VPALDQGTRRKNAKTEEAIILGLPAVVAGEDYSMMIYQPDKVCAPSEYESLNAKGFEVYDLMRRKAIAP